MNKKLEKLMKLFGVDNLSDSEQVSISNEISRIIKNNDFVRDGRYNKLFELMKMNRNNRELISECREKLDEILPQIRIDWIETKNSNSSKQLYEMYFPKKDSSTNKRKKIKVDDFLWGTHHSECVNESMESWMNVWGGRNKIYVDENNRVLHTDTYLVNIGDELNDSQIEYLKQKGIVFILKKTGE